MRRAILTDADGIVGEDVNVRQPGERGEPDGWAAIVRENKKRRARSAEDTMIADAVHDRAHAVFANAEVNVTARIVVAGEIAATLDVVEGRTVQIGAAA